MRLPQGQFALGLATELIFVRVFVGSFDDDVRNQLVSHYRLEQHVVGVEKAVQDTLPVVVVVPFFGQSLGVDECAGAVVLVVKADHGVDVFGEAEQLDSEVCSRVRVTHVWI